MTSVRLLLVLASAAPLVAAPVPKDFDPQPTAEQLRAAKEAVEKLGGNYAPHTDDTGRVRHVFDLKPATEEWAEQFPSIPFRFDLNVHVLHADVLSRLRPTRLLASLTLKYHGREDGLRHLSKFVGLTELALNGPTTEIGLKHIGRLRELVRLRIRSLEINGSELTALAGLGNLTHLNLSHSTITDAAVEPLAALPNLRALDLSLDPNWSTVGGVTDVGLERLHGLRNLTALNLRYANVTDAGLKALAKHPKLTELDLFSVKATDGGVRDLLAAKPGLTKLNLGRVELTDAGTKGLENLVHLVSLCLSHTGIGEATLERIGKLRQLTDLNLYYSEKVTDAGVTWLAGLDRLETLNLGNTAVTDATLEEVAKWKSLKRLGLSRSVGPIKITNAGEEAFRKARPDVVIHRDY